MTGSKGSLQELARVFLRLGVSSFGGPAVHIANMHDECVKRRRWLSSEEFLDLLGATNFIPGPNSTEMAIHIGFTRAGVAGLIVAGVCFIMPAALIVVAVAILYVRYGTLPQFESMLYAVKPVVIAVILRAVFDLGRTAVKNVFLAILAAVAAVWNLMGAGELTVLFGSGVLALVWSESRRLSGSLSIVPPQIFFYFLKIGSVLFGSGYVLVALLRADLVDRLGLLDQRQLLDAIAVGQLTPGPLFTTATFVGYLLDGGCGAFAATIGVFLPAFVLVGLTHPFVRRMRHNATAKALLDGINAAAVALMLVVTSSLARAAIVDAFTIAIAILAGALLWKFRSSSAWLVLGAALIGLAYQ